MSSERKVRNPDSPDPKCHLYEFRTYAPTPRLTELRTGAGNPPSKEEIGILWDVYVGESDEVAATPTIKEFAQWLTGTGPFEGEPMEVYN